MLNRVKKAVLTKRFRRHLRNYRVVRFKHRNLSLYIVPGTDKVTCLFSNSFQEVLSPPRVSDYIVESGLFSSFWDEFKDI